tara:strand:+ start:4245 stop:4724 length:480 start_codon:yes stop_codon:yes gene_type:complete
MSYHQLIYLAGPIQGQTYDEAVVWRTEFAKEINVYAPSTRCLSPMRDKEELIGSEKIEGKHEDSFWCSEDLIRVRDISDIRRCDLMLVNLLGADKGRGTVWEMGFAAALGKPMVVLAEEDVREHPLLSYGAVFPDIHALNLTKHVALLCGSILGLGAIW